MSRQLYCAVCTSEIMRVHGRLDRESHYPNHSIATVGGTSVCEHHLAAEIVRSAGNPSLADIVSARPDEDGRRARFLSHARLQYAGDLIVKLRAGMLSNRPMVYRESLVELGALMLGAVESFDRSENAA